jgi:hypothetical protein
MLACLSRKDPLALKMRIALLFLMPSNANTLVQQMQVFEQSVQQSIWVTSYGQGVVLRVKFLTGTQSQRDSVREIVEQKINLPQFMNVRFDFVGPNDAGDIRVTFYENQHSWSAIGKDALFIPQDVPTLNLSDLSPGNILHQFAHALGFPHEQKYEPHIEWNRALVNDAFAGPPHFWKTPQSMQYNFYDVYNVNQFFNYKTFNARSLMLNIWPCSFFNDDAVPCDLDLPSDYATQDKRFFASFYSFLPRNIAGTQITFGSKLDKLKRIVSAPLALQSLSTLCPSTRSNFVLWTSLSAVFLVCGLVCLVLILVYGRAGA